MSNNKLRTTVSINIANGDKWSEIPNSSSFTSKLIDDYLSGKLVRVELPEKFEKKCEDYGKELLIKKLLIDYCNDNILFVDELQKMSKIMNSGVLLNNISNMVNNNDLQEEAQNESQTILNTDNDILVDKDKKTLKIENNKDLYDSLDKINDISDDTIKENLNNDIEENINSQPADTNNKNENINSSEEEAVITTTINADEDDEDDESFNELFKFNV